MGKPIIIFYSECLSSYLLFSEFIKKYPDLIECLVKLPVLPRKTNKNFFNIFPALKRIFSRSSIAFLFFNFITIFCYNAVAFLFRNRLSDLAKRLGIPVYKEFIIDKAFLEKIEGLKPDWIFNNTAYILKNDIISVPKFGILNYHSAPLPKFRGAANYFWLLFAEEKSANGTLHYVIEKLDAGDIICESEKIAIIKNMTIFDLWFKIRLAAFGCYEKTLDFIRKREKIPARSQNYLYGQTRSFPGKDIWKKIKKSGHKIFSLADYKNIILIGIKGRILRN